MSESAAAWPWCTGEMAARCRAFDWGATPLGPIDAWPDVLRHTLATMLESTVPMVVAWGSPGIYLYNDALRTMLGQRHPRQFGLPLVDAWPEIRTEVAEMLETALAGRTLQRRGTPFDLLRNGSSERVLFDVDCSPIRDAAGTPAGMLLVIRELARERAVREAEAVGRREHSLLALSDAIRDLGDPGEIHDVAAMLLGAHLDVDRIGHADGRRGGFIVREGWEQGHAQTAWPAASLGVCLFGDGHLQGGVVVDDTARDPRLTVAMRTLLQAHDVLAVGAPAPRGSGIDRFAALSRTPRQWTTDELDLLREVGERVHAATEKARARFALASSEARFRAVAEQAAAGIVMADRDARLVYVNDRHCEVMGRARETLIGCTIQELTHPDDWPHDAERMATLYRDGTAFTVEKRVLVDGQARWVRLSVSPWRDAAGAVVGSVAVSLDLSSRRLAEHALRDSEARFRQFGDASSDVLWIRDVRTLTLEYLSPAFEAIYGQMREVSLANPDYWLSMVHPDDVAAVRATVRRVRRGARASYEFRIVRPMDGRVVWVRNTDFPIYDEAGQLQRIGGIGRDITREREDGALMETLVAELQHRTRNLIAVVQSLALRTQQESTDVTSFGRRFEQRLDALGRVQTLLSKRPDGQPVTFDALLRQELDAHGVGAPDTRVVLQGPSGVALRARVVQTLALALHELTTNALKYGALSDAGGRLEIEWGVRDAPGTQGLLQVSWRETGVRRAPEVMSGGYGRELIERALPYQLKAQTQYRLREDGVDCLIELSLGSGLTAPVAKKVRADPG